jgi:hypothetical protein
MNYSIFPDSSRNVSSNTGVHCLPWKSIFNYLLNKFPLRGAILRPPGGNVSQTIVFRYTNISGTYAYETSEKVMILSKYSLEINIKQYHF